MRWEDERESSNVEDVRGFPIGGRSVGIGCGGLVIVLIISLITGISPLKILNLLQGTDASAPTSQAPPAPPPVDGSGRNSGQTGQSGQPGSAAPADKLGKFASVVLASTEDVWSDIFAKSGRSYQPPKLVLFTGGVRSACGMTSSAVGPFYCQLDRKVYLDLSFFRELSQRFGAPGEFADAYVIAHEVGHHIQNSLGVFDRQGGLGNDNRASVALELQADCFAGVWGNHANQGGKHLIEPGDFESGLKAASSIGDDRLQRMSQGYVAPESFTHGSSRERVGWLRRGLETGDPGKCDTFRGGLE
jgi:predicted metalloprotease